MEYDFAKIGRRIKLNRISCEMSQTELIKCLSDMGVSVGRNKLSAIENGTATKETFSLALLTGLCKIFDCEIGYLLYEPGYECRTRTKTDICNETGLTLEAVEVLETALRNGDESLLDSISRLIELSSVTGGLIKKLENMADTMRSAMYHANN